LGFFRNRRKGSAVKNLAGALHVDRVDSTLSVGREVKMEIPARMGASLQSLRVPITLSALICIVIAKNLHHSWTVVPWLIVIAVWASYFWSDRVEGSPSLSKPTQFAWASFLIVLGMACAVRLYKLGEFPLGPCSDEVFTLNNSLHLLEHPLDLFGQTPLVSEGWVETTNLYLYFSVLILKVFGVRYWSMKLLSVIPGVIACGAVFLISQEMFDRTGIALWTALLFTFGHWPVRLSRYGWDASFMVMGFSLSIWLLCVAMQRGHPFYAYCSGVTAGLSLYSYLAARICLISLLGFLVLEWVLRRNRSTFRQAIAFASGAATVAFPLVLYYRSNPAVISVRTAQLSAFNVDHPFWVIVNNVWRHALMFHTFGGTYARDNFPGLPMMDPLTGLLFILGFVIVVRRTTTPFARLILCALVLNFAGGIFSVSREGPPYVFRTAAVMIPAFLIAGFGVQWVMQKGCKIRFVASSLLLLTIVLNLHLYFGLEAHNAAAMRVMAYELRIIGLEIARDDRPVYLVGRDILDPTELGPRPEEEYADANRAYILPAPLGRLAVIAFSERYDLNQTVSHNLMQPRRIYFVESAQLETDEDSIQVPAKIIFRSNDLQLRQVVRTDYPNAPLRDLRDLFGEPLLTVATIDTN
jgi:4-amino-4-deoxy-L-arabinose transferase-like glycosyltransferase